MSEWQKVPLHELYEFSSGLSKPRSAFGSGYPFLSFKDVFYSFFVPMKLGELVNSTDKERAACSIRRGDVFFTRTSETMNELGMSCVALHDIPDGTFNGFTKRLRPKENGKVVPEYAGYFFRSPAFRQAVTAMSSMATRASLNNEMLSRLSITLPSLAEQTTIGHILGTLDNKIELNQQMNGTLEAMARALFKSWFVDFDPVRAKSEGHKSEGMDAATAALFPAAFNDDGLPEGWDKVPFSRLIEIIGGGTPKTSVSKYWNGTIPWFSVVDAPADTDIYVIDTEKKITQTGVDNSSTRVLPLGTTIISARGTVGRVALVGFPMAMNQSCYGIRGANDLPDYFTYFCVRQLVAELKARTHGSVFDTITRDTFDTVSFVKPDKKIAAAFDEAILPLMQKVLNNLRENRTLTSLRDVLLPKLISGELRIDDAVLVRREAAG